MSSETSISGRREASEQSSSGKRAVDEAIYSGCKRIKHHEFQTNLDSEDPESSAVVAYRAAREDDDRSPRSKYADSSRLLCVSENSSSQANAHSELNLEAFHCWLESAKLEDEKTLQKIDATTTDATDCKRCSRDEKLPFARLYHFPAPASLSQSSNENHDQTRSASLGSHQREISSSSSEYSMSPHREGSRSPDLTTPRSGPDSSENSSIASSSSPRLRTSSLAPPQSYSGERTHSALSSTERTQRTPLPTKKGPNSTRNPSEAMQEKELETHRAPVIRGLSYAESAISPRERSVDLPVDISLKRKSLSPRVVSSEPIHVDSSQTKILSVAGNYSRYRSPSATSSCDNVGTDASTRSRTRSSSSMVLSPDYPGTPPRKRAALEEARMQGSMTEGTASAPYTTLSPNFTPTTSESIDQNQNARNKLVKRRGRKPANINTAEHCHLNDSPSVTSSSDQISLSNNLKRDNIKDRPPRQLPPLDHTPRIILQNQDPSQPYAKISPTKQSENIPPQPHRILPPRPSITPPPGSSAQPLQKYRPPAVVFTIDNRAESRMLTADVQSFIEQFTKNARVVAPSTQPSTSSYIYPISVIMWQSLSDFYKWYTEATGSTAIGPLRFELVDVQWQTEKAFVIPEGNLNDFRILKQYVWDLFWVASNLNNGLSLFQVSISSFPSRGVDVLSTPSSWHPVNSTSPPPRTSGTGSLENIMVVAEPRTLLASKSSPRLAPHSPAISTSTSRTSNIKHILNSKEVKEVKGRAGRRTTVPPSNQSAGKSSIDASSSNRVPRPSDYIHGPPGPPFNTHRTSWDKASLCDRAHAYLAGRNDMEVLSEESTVHDKLPYKTGAEVCGAFVDRNSGKGLVTVTGKGFITQNVTTGPDETGDRYKEINIQAKQTCMLHGDAVVLYYKRRSFGAPQQSVQPSHQNQQKPQSVGLDTTSTAGTPSPIEIIVRLQIDGTGKFSAPFDKSVLRPKVNTTEFFSWFSTQTRRGGPHGPPCLKFTFKDAMPSPKATEVSRGNEDHFNYMRKDIKAQCEKAKAYMPDLKEFVILVTVPNWSTPKGEEEEDW